MHQHLPGQDGAGTAATAGTAAVAGTAGTTTVPRPPSVRAGAARAAVIEELGVLRCGPQERFDRITRTARALFDVSSCFLSVIDGSEQHVLSPLGGPITRFPLAASLCRLTIAGTDPVVVPDAAADERTRDLGFVRGPAAVRFYAGAPVTTPSGTPIGTICVMDTVARELTAEDVALLEDLARWAGRELAAGRCREDLRTVAQALRPAPLVVDGYEIDGRTTGVEPVHGAFSDWSRDGEDVVLTTAGVSGDAHGAAVLAAGLRGAVRARNAAPVSAAIADTEAQIGCEFTAAGVHAAMFHARLTPASGRVEFVDAGLGLVVRVPAEGDPTVLAGHGLPVGLHRGGLHRDAETIELAPGESLLVASDAFLRLHDDTVAALENAGRLLAAAEDVPSFFALVERQAARRGVVDGVSMLVVRRAA